MSTSAADGATSDSSQVKPTTETSEAAAGDTTQPQDSLEDLLRSLNKQIKGSDWLEKNTAEKWMEENPAAAQELEYIIVEKQTEKPTTSQQPASESAQKQ